MNPVYVGDKFDKRVPSIFLAGPSPRSFFLRRTWRDDALSILDAEVPVQLLPFPERPTYEVFSGNVFIPLREDGGFAKKYEDQVHWEWKALGSASVILFWVPRSIDLPGLTTNVEFGFSCMLRPDRVVFGAPRNAWKTRYLRKLADDIRKFNDYFGKPFSSISLKPIPTYYSLEQTLAAAVTMAIRCRECDGEGRWDDASHGSKMCRPCRGTGRLD